MFRTNEWMQWIMKAMNYECNEWKFILYFPDVSVQSVAGAAKRFTIKTLLGKLEKRFTTFDASLAQSAENNSPPEKYFTCSPEMTDSSAEITTSNKVRNDNKVFKSVLLDFWSQSTDKFIVHYTYAFSQNPNT